MTGFLHDPIFFSQHNKQSHPENSSRLALVQKPENVQPCGHRPATDDELLAVHSIDHLNRVKAKCSGGGGMLDPDTYCLPESEAVARSAAGGLVDLSLGVLDGTYANGLAVVRPPGHHATRNEAMGFCLYNYVAVAAAAIRANGIPKVAIIDFDVHHGNGTQDIFYADDSVLYVSSHQYPHFPGSGTASEKGTGAGDGFTVNCPLAEGDGDEEFLGAYRDNLLPVVVAFDPDFILVSAGYDAHASDPLAGLRVSTEGFVTLVGMLMQMADETCGGKIVFSLEGGYEASALGACLQETARILGNKGS